MDDCSFAQANLGGASFRSVNFLNANFSGAKLGATAFIDCDLSSARGLDECAHYGPSYLDIATLVQSASALTDHFLRRAGIPEILIDYMPALIAQPIQLFSSFISFASPDQIFADRLHADLQARGVRCWYSPKSMALGDRIRDRINQSIRVYDKTIVILSKHSIQSSWVENEVEAAFEKESQLSRTGANSHANLIPITIDDTFRTSEKAWVRTIVRSRHIGDFRDWENAQVYVSALKLLKDALRKG